MPYGRPLALCLGLGGDSHQSRSLTQSLPVLGFPPGTRSVPCPAPPCPAPLSAPGLVAVTTESLFMLPPDRRLPQMSHPINQRHPLRLRREP